MTASEHSLPGRRTMHAAVPILTAALVLGACAGGFVDRNDLSSSEPDRVVELRLAGDLAGARDLATALLEGASARRAVELHIELARIADRVGLHRNTRPVAAALEHVELAAAANAGDAPDLEADITLARAQFTYRAEMQAREFHQTRTLAENAADAYRLLSDPHGQADAVHLLGLVALQRRELPEARRLFDESLRLDLTASPRVFFRGEYERHIAFVDLFEGNPEAALPHLQHSLEARRDAGAIDASLFAASTLVNTLLDLTRTEEARPVVEYGLAVAEQIDSPRGRARMHLSAGRYHVAAEEHVLARSAFQRALEHAGSVGIDGLAQQARAALAALTPN